MVSRQICFLNFQLDTWMVILFLSCFQLGLLPNNIHSRINLIITYSISLGHWIDPFSIQMFLILPMFRRNIRHVTTIMRLCKALFCYIELPFSDWRLEMGGSTSFIAKDEDEEVFTLIHFFIRIPSFEIALTLLVPSMHFCEHNTHNIYIVQISHYKSTFHYL